SSPHCWGAPCSPRPRSRGRDSGASSFNISTPAIIRVCRGSSRSSPFSSSWSACSSTSSMPMSTRGSDTESVLRARRLRLLPERWLRPWHEAGRFARTVVWVGAGITLLFIFIAIFAPLLWHYSGTAYQGIPKLAPPSAKHPFGTTSINFDVLARVLYGARLALDVVALPV